MRKVVPAEAGPRFVGLPLLRSGPLLAVIMLSAVALPAAAQFFPMDRPARQARQPEPFGGFGFPSPPQQQGSFFGGPDLPQARRNPALSDSRFPFHPRVFRRPVPPPSIDYSHAPSPEKPDTPPKQTVLVLGDSMADWLAYGLEEVVRDQSDLGVVRKSKTVSGLIKYQTQRSEPPDWIAAAKEIVAAEKADIVVVMLGLHDRVTIRESRPETPVPSATEPKEVAETPAESEAPSEETDATPPITPDKNVRRYNSVREFRDAGWVERYTRKIQQMIAVLKTRGAPVIWVGLPAVRGQRPTSDMLFLNALYRESAAKAGITYVDVWDGFVDEAGRFLQHGPDFEGQTRRLRSPDGVFFTKKGALKLAHYADREIRRLLTARAPNAVPLSEPAPLAAVPLAKSGNAQVSSRPLAGPVVPLVASVVGTSELLGGAGARPPTVDALVARTLVKGEPLSAPAGRADDYTWPRREMGRVDVAKDTLPVSDAPGRLAEQATTGGARLRYSQQRPQ
jgi:uncharacterized protein